MPHHSTKRAMVPSHVNFYTSLLQLRQSVSKVFSYTSVIWISRRVKVNKFLYRSYPRKHPYHDRHLCEYYGFVMTWKPTLQVLVMCWFTLAYQITKIRLKLQVHILSLSLSTWYKTICHLAGSYDIRLILTRNCIQFTITAVQLKINQNI